MSAERVRITFVHRLGEQIAFRGDPQHPYCIQQQRYTKSVTGTQWIEYGIVRVDDPATARITWTTPNALAVWRATGRQASDG